MVEARTRTPTKQMIIFFLAVILCIFYIQDLHSQFMGIVFMEDGRSVKYQTGINFEKEILIKNLVSEGFTSF